MRFAIVFTGLIAVCLSSPFAFAATVVSTDALTTAGLHQDFPAMCLDKEGTPHIAYLAFDGKQDSLKVAKKTKDGLQPIEGLSANGIIHQPAITVDGNGTICVVWSQLDNNLKWSLKAQAITDGSPAAKAVTIDDESGSAVFADAGTDSQGRVWVAWQSFRKSSADIYAKYFDPKTEKWSDEIRITEDKEGDWEPQLAFTDGATWIAYDSSRGGIYNVYLAKVVDGGVTTAMVSESLRYDARPSIAAAPDGKSLWLAWESGKLRWGRNTRGVSGTIGLNADRRIVVAQYDIASGETITATDATPIMKTAGAPRPIPKASATPTVPAKKKAAPKKPPGVQTINLPQVMVDAAGNPWITCRYYRGVFWRIALMKYDAAGKTWSKPITLPNTPFSQDRRTSVARDDDGQLWLAWPSDLRVTKAAKTCGVYLAQVDPTAEIPAAPVVTAKPKPPVAAKPRWGDLTPERPREDRHNWTTGEKRLGLYWGDFHRHTDISDCRTAHDGCIVEQFRYAYDIGKIDMLGTSDHTDIGKPYDPYEWWCNQKLMDVFFAPGYFVSFYVYEREQRWPWGHRNVIFGERGGPLVYIKRQLYKSMPWQDTFPVPEGAAEISPEELWSILRKSEKPVTVISHTGATGMGTNWDGYKKIDNAVENLVEIYQGARVSYEGVDTPQPTVGFPKGVQLAPDAHGSIKVGKGFGQHNKGVYRNALKNGWKLGVFANSDHISTHTTFGGVYAESFTRDGLLEGFNARRTIAATDKIFMEFSCNGHLLGEVFTIKEKPTLKIKVEGTAPLLAVTLVRNEADFQRFTPGRTTKFETMFTDETPAAGENRYYVRVEQTDGNMGWTSPVWVTIEK